MKQTKLICQFCKEPFVSRRSDAKFCSPSHRVLAHYEKWGAASKKREEEERNRLNSIAQHKVSLKEKEILASYNQRENERIEALFAQAWEDMRFSNFKYKTQTFLREVETLCEDEWIDKREINTILRDLERIMDVEYLKNKPADYRPKECVENILFPYFMSVKAAFDKQKEKDIEFVPPSEILDVLEELFEVVGN